MAQFGPYWEVAVMRHITGSQNMTQLTVYVGLCTAAPLTAAGSNPALCECATNTGGYTRQGIGTNQWVAVSGSSPAVTYNSASFSWTTSTTSWGDVLYVALFNTSTINDGNVLAFATMPATKTIGTGDQAILGTQSLSLQLT